MTGSADRLHRRRWQSANNCAVILDPSTFKTTRYIRSITSIRTGARWAATIASTRYIYGIGMMADRGTLMGNGASLANRPAAFYIDNNNAILEILKNPAKPMAMQAMTGLLWNRIRELNITPLIERVQSKRIISGLPTRRFSIKYKSSTRRKCRMTIERKSLIGRTIDRITKCLPIEPHSLGGETIAPHTGNKIRTALLNPYNGEPAPLVKRIKPTPYGPPGPVHRTLTE